MSGRNDVTAPVILVVDDNPITCKLVRFTLEQQGFSIVEAGSGAAAIAALDRRHPDLILQDLILPDTDGFDLVGQLRARSNGREVPILAFSGFLSQSEESRVSAVGFDGVVVKPIEPSRLVQIVRAHLPSPRPAHDRFGEGRRLLVVDDDAVQLKLARFRLARLGFEIDTAADGVAALEQIRARRPDAVVSDIMMPRLDGFGLCLAIRRDDGLARLPIVLMTNSYIEDADRGLAEQVGTSAFVVRTPDFREVVGALEGILDGDGEAPPPRPVAGEVEEQRMHRVLRQLERQVSLSRGMAQRSASLAAELCVLSGISDALTRHGDPGAALDTVLAACLDAGGISAGALFILGDDGALTVRSSGRELTVDRDSGAGSAEAFRDFFGQPELLRAILDGGRVVAIPSPQVPEDPGSRLLERSGALSALVAPLLHRGRALGALVMLSHDAALDQEDRITFAQGVAGQIAQALALARAFTQQQASERKAQHQAEVLTSVLGSIGDGVVVWDRDLGFTIWNRAAEAILGRGPTALPPEQWAAHYGLYLPDKVTPFPVDRMPMTRSLGGESIDRVEMFVRWDDTDSKGRWLSASSRPIFDGDGHVQAAVTVLRDTTAEKAAQAQLMVSDRMASVGMLAAGVAHEINNPLAAVIANLDLAVRDCSDVIEQLGGNTQLEDLSEEIGDAVRAAERVRLIVRDLKLFSRAEDEAREAIDVRRVLDSSLRMAWTEIRHRARLVKNYQDVPPVVANESRLGQVFLNLIVNAAQAIAEGRADQNEIRLTTRANGDRVEIDVTDTGPGIPPQVMAHLFTPFFTTKPIGVGTGLGLSICQRLISSVGGEITVDTELGRGTTFRVSLPRRVDDVAEAPVEQGPAPVPPAPLRARILVIDDDEAICRSIKRMLGREHDVVALTLADKALDEIRAGARFDLILCDLMMPVMTGIDLFNELGQVAPEQAARMVFVTGGAFTAKARAFLDQVPNQRIEKPFDMRRLADVIRERLT